MHTFFAKHRFLGTVMHWVPGRMHQRLFCVALMAQACALPMAQAPGYAGRKTLMPQVGVVTVQNQAGYLSYHASTLRDVSNYTYVRQARGEACQRGVGLPYAMVRNFFSGGRTDGWFSADVRWGEGTLHKAMSQATATMRADEALVDVTIDQHYTSVLAILYRQVCLVVQGRIVAPLLPALFDSTDGASAPPPAPSTAN